MNELLKIQAWRTLLLPFWWHRTIVGQWRPDVMKIIKTAPASTLYLNHSVKTAICLFDKRFIDQAIKDVDLSSRLINERWQAYLDVGKALYDLGDRNRGIDFLEQAVKISLESDHPTISPDIALYHLCSRLNGKEYWDRRLEYAILFEKNFPEQDLARVVLARSYIDLKQYEKAEPLINDLTQRHLDYMHLWSEYYFAKEDYLSASNLFNKYLLDESQHVYLPVYDYKELVSYYKTNQIEKWQDKAKKIGRRLVWDKFYRLDYLENEGVQRFSEIDKVIDASRNQKRWICPDKLLFILKRIPWMIWQFFWIYRYAILIYLVGFVFIGMLIRAFLKS